MGNYFENEDFSINLNLQEEVFVHIDVNNWNKSVLKDIKEEFSGLKDKAKDLGFDALYAYTPNTKFVKMVDDYEVEGEFEEGGVKYTVIKWELGVS